MSPSEAKTIADYLIPLMEQEVVTTRKVLAAVPDQGADYRPDEKSKTGAELAFHVASADIWFLDSILAGEFTNPGKPPATPKPSESLALYDSRVPALVAKLKELTGEQLIQPTTFFVWTNPRVQYLSLYQHHSIHHRGQLSTYLRAMGGRVPSIYGGSADEAVSMPPAEASA
jgi:uncharacterized damage-inducible protein DinB